MADGQTEFGTMPMLELVQLMAGDDTAMFRAAVDEVQRRWNAAAAVQGEAWTAFHPPGWSQRRDEPVRADPIDLPYNLAVIDDARQFLSVQTLINELWILQEAGVEPAGLFLDRDAPARVFEVLQAESNRNEAEPSTDNHPTEDLLVDGAAFLARCVERTLFGESDRVLNDHLRLAGNMREDLLQQCTELTLRAHADLDGSWSLASFLANPSGSGYYLPQMVGPRNPYEGVAIALGRRGNLPTRADIDASRAATGAELAAEVVRVIRDDPPLAPSELRDMPRTRLVGVHSEMRAFTDFLEAALGVARLAEDHVVRLDSRPVAADMRGWVLGRLIDRARWPDEKVGTLTLAGAQVTLTADQRGVVALVDVAGTHKEFAVENLRAVLAVLDAPDALTGVAKMRAGVDQIGRDLKEGHTRSTPRRPRDNDQRRGFGNAGRPDSDDQRRSR